MRKLATAAFSFAAAIFLALYLLPNNWLLIAGAIFAAASLFGLLFKNDMRIRIFIVFISFAVGLTWSWAFSATFTASAGELHDQFATVTAVVTEFPAPRTRGYHVEVRIRQHEGKDIRPIGARLRYFRTTELQPGDIIEFTARFSRTDGFGDLDRIDGLSSRGTFLSALIAGDIEVTGSAGRWRYFPQRLSYAIAGRADRLFPDDVSPFIQALIVGRRADLRADAELNAALTASGIIHVVSVSGLHVTFLMGFLAVFIDRKKRLFAMIGLPVLFLFMMMTGLNPPVVRAGIMQLFIICAPIFGRKSDSITSISAALLILLVMNPYSAGSIGLHLSFAATIGLVLFAPRIHLAFTHVLRRTKLYDKSIRAHAVRFVTASFATTFAAISLTIPLTAIHFGRVAIISPITNLLTLWAVSIAFTFGMAASVLGFIFMPLGSIVAYPVTIAARYTLDIARAMAAMPFASVYSSNTLIVAWLVYVYAMFITFTVFLRARVRQYLTPVCLMVIALCAVLLVTPLVSEASAIDGKAITVLDVGQGQSIVITSGEFTAMIDCGSMSGENAGSIAHEFLMNQGRTTLDILILTHFHSDHANGIDYLLTRLSVSAIAIPAPDGSYMSHIAEDIIDLARRRGADIIYVTETLQVSLGDAVLMLYPPLDERDENERGLSILSICGSSDFRALVTGDMSSAGERALLRFAYIPTIDMLVVGHHGSRRSTSEELLYATRPGLAVISVGRNSFGHPSYETLTRLEVRGIPVLRTDIMGHITVTGS